MVRADVRPSGGRGARPTVSKRVVVATMLTTWLLALFFSLATYTLSDDHFGRIAPARQMARYGELPFRDFFDPGYFLTEAASASVQRLFGDNLLGEMLLVSVSVAIGAVLILVLVRRATGSVSLACVTTALAVLAFQRAYDYDKFLFYPLGLLACWRYADRRTGRDLVALAAVAVLAGMFRYDNGLFILVCGFTVLAAVHASEFAVLTKRAGMLVAACLLCVAPYVVFLQVNGGVAEALRQMATYARREGARTSIGTLPSGALSTLQVTALPPPPPDRVQIRWTPDADQERADLETRYSLHDGVGRGNPDDRTWLYEIDNATPANLRALVNEPRVADTHLIDRERLLLAPQESRRTRLWRRLPLLGTRSISWNAAGAAAITFYLFLVVSLVSVAKALSRHVERAERARVLSAAVMTLLSVAFILRDPVVARIGGVIGPPAVLAAWTWRRFTGHRRVRAVVAVCVILILAIATEWEGSVYRLQRNGGRIGRIVSEAAVTPPLTALLPKPRLAGMVDYLRRCTRPDDRVFAAWFVPELYFFSGRAFAGGMVVTFGGHWSEPVNQRRIVEKMMTESVPVVLVREGDESFSHDYPIVAEYLGAHYRLAGSSDFGGTDGGNYTVLTRIDRVADGTDAATSMPCFARSA